MVDSGSDSGKTENEVMRAMRGHKPARKGTSVGGQRTQFTMTVRCFLKWFKKVDGNKTYPKVNLLVCPLEMVAAPDDLRPGATRRTDGLPGFIGPVSIVPYTVDGKVRSRDCEPYCSDYPEDEFSNGKPFFVTINLDKFKRGVPKVGAMLNLRVGVKATQWNGAIRYFMEGSGVEVLSDPKPCSAKVYETLRRAYCSAAAGSLIPRQPSTLQRKVGTPFIVVANTGDSHGYPLGYTKVPIKKDKGGRGGAAFTADAAFTPPDGKIPAKVTFSVTEVTTPSSEEGCTADHTVHILTMPVWASFFSGVVGGMLPENLVAIINVPVVADNVPYLLWAEEDRDPQNRAEYPGAPPVFTDDDRAAARHNIGANLLPGNGLANPGTANAFVGPLHVPLLCDWGCVILNPATSAVVDGWVNGASRQRDAAMEEAPPFTDSDVHAITNRVPGYAFVPGPHMHALPEGAARVLADPNLLGVLYSYNKEAGSVDPIRQEVLDDLAATDPADPAYLKKVFLLVPNARVVLVICDAETRAAVTPAGLDAPCVHLDPTKPFPGVKLYHPPKKVGSRSASSVAAAAASDDDDDDDDDNVGEPNPKRRRREGTVPIEADEKKKNPTDDDGDEEEDFPMTQAV